MNIKYRIIIFPKNKRQGSVHVNDQSTIWWKHITYYLISIANFSCYALSVFKDKIDNWTMDCKNSTHVINFFCYFYYFYVVFMQKPFKLKIENLWWWFLIIIFIHLQKLFNFSWLQQLPAVRRTVVYKHRPKYLSLIMLISRWLHGKQLQHFRRKVLLLPIDSVPSKRCSKFDDSWSKEFMPSFL